jgi:hypothetical protein
MKSNEAGSRSCPRCSQSGAALRPQTRDKICLHQRLTPIEFAKVFWDEA